MLSGGVQNLLTGVAVRQSREMSPWRHSAALDSVTNNNLEHRNYSVIDKYGLDYYNTLDILIVC
jgi:hypothetical protein